MNYENFLTYKNQLLKEKPDLIDLSETNIYKYYNFQNIYDELIKGHVNRKIHRCHLVEDWLKYNELNQIIKNIIGVSKGVRNSLDILTNHFKNEKWHIPEDVYPYYQNLLNKKDIKYTEYQTLNKDINPNNIDSDILLITYPLKPSGRTITSQEFKNIKEWLNKNKNRRLILDCVYLNNKHDLKKLLKYFDRHQTYYLFSLSKTFCLPEVLGLTIIAENDLFLKEEYKKILISDFNLNIAYQALNYPDYKKRDLFILRMNFENYQKTKKIIELPQFNGGYLFYVKNNFKDLLKENILSIPPSVFGSKQNSGSIISTLIKF